MATINRERSTDAPPPLVDLIVEIDNMKNRMIVAITAKSERGSKYLQRHSLLRMKMDDVHIYNLRVEWHDCSHDQEMREVHSAIEYLRTHYTPEELKTIVDEWRSKTQKEE